MGTISETLTFTAREKEKLAEDSGSRAASDDVKDRVAEMATAIKSSSRKGQKSDELHRE